MAVREKGSILSPLSAIKFLGRKPVTIRVPYEMRPTAERYRGFHVNDLDKCIGCGTCAEICDNDAIRMIEIPGIKPEPGKSTMRPVIDYGRCCWCALCVDMCTTNSLSMTREYIHVDHELDSFLIFPDLEGIHKKPFPLGYCADDQVNFLDLERVEMEELPPEERIQSFVEIVKGFSKEQAIAEASRCVGCGLCTDACPANMNIPEYIDAIWNDDLPESAREIYKTNPLPEVCGRVCTHKCESACSIGHRGDPVAIRWLKRYAMDNIPAEEYKKILGNRVVKPTGKKVAIVGAGPAGLSAAYYLVQMGYEIEVFEQKPLPGGMMRYGIPEYRLPYDMLDKDIDFMKELGVKFTCNTRVGNDVTLEQLHEKFDVVMVATGLHLGRSTRVPGADHRDVFQAIDLLARITMGEEIKVDPKIVVIGGGNVAMDIARSLARLQTRKYGKVDIVVTCLETRDIMPADEEEIIESQEEGIVFYPGRGPKEVLIENDKIVGLKTIKCTRVFDEEHRFSPEFDESDEMTFQCSMVVEAIGQAPDTEYLGEFKDKLDYAGRRIAVNEYYQTNLDWLFVAGDLVKGPDVINGIATGHKAALGIDRQLSRKPVKEITTIDEMLDFAIQFEIHSYNFYRKFLGKFTPEVNSIIQELCDQEKLHRDNLMKIKENQNIRIFLKENLERPQLADNFQECLVPAQIGDDASVEDVLRVGMARERAAYGFYRDVERMTKNKELRFLLRYLQGEEHKHLKRLEDEYYREVYNTI